MKKVAIKSLVVAVLSCISISSFSGTHTNYKNEQFPASNQYAYLGLGLGYGWIDSNPSTFFGSLLGNTTDLGILSPILNPILNPTRESGGFGGRIYTGYMFDVTEKFMMGPEFGFSMYTSTTADEDASQALGLLAKLIGGSDPESLIDIDYASSAETKGYGFDLLINASYYPTKRFSFYVKPGIQIAYEKTSYDLDFKYSELDLLTGQGMVIPFTSDYSYSTTMVTPEVIIGGNWRLMDSMPIFLGASYQHVFSTYSWNDTNDRVSDRDLFTFNLEYQI